MAEITGRDQRRLIPITSSSFQQLIHHNDGGGQNFFFISCEDEKKYSVAWKTAAVAVMIIG